MQLQQNFTLSPDHAEVVKGVGFTDIILATRGFPYFSICVIEAVRE